MARAMIVSSGIVAFALLGTSAHPAVAGSHDCFALEASSGAIRITPSKLLADVFWAPIKDGPPLADGNYRADVELVFEGGSRKLVAGFEVTPENAERSLPRRFVFLFGGTTLQVNLDHLVVCNAEFEPTL